MVQRLLIQRLLAKLSLLSPISIIQNMKKISSTSNVVRPLLTSESHCLLVTKLLSIPLTSPLAGGLTVIKARTVALIKKKKKGNRGGEGGHRWIFLYSLSVYL